MTIDSISEMWKDPDRRHRVINTLRRTGPNKKFDNEHLKLALQTMNQEEELGIDSLTKLPNKRGFQREVEKMYKELNRRKAREQRLELAEKSTLIIGVIDLDNFKAKINDRYGHPAGDKVLQVFAGIIKKSLREGDVASRLHGDEFALGLLTDDGLDATMESLKNRLQLQIEFFKRNNAQVDYIDAFSEFAVSLGFGVFQNGEFSFDQLYKRADVAMYNAKAIPKTPGQVVVVPWSDEMKVPVSLPNHR